MTLQIAGEKTHFIVLYDDAVGAPALAVANMVLGLCEVDLLRLSAILPYLRGGNGDPFVLDKILIQIINDPVPTPDDPTGGPKMSWADESGGLLGPVVSASIPSPVPASPSRTMMLGICSWPRWPS